MTGRGTAIGTTWRGNRHPLVTDVPWYRNFVYATRIVMELVEGGIFALFTLSPRDLHVHRGSESPFPEPWRMPHATQIMELVGGGTQPLSLSPSSPRETSMVNLQEFAMEKSLENGTEATKNRRSLSAPLPPEAPLLSFEDVAAFLRITPAAVRTLINGRADGSDGALGSRLRAWVVRLSPRRRYIRKDLFMAWLSDLAHKSIA